MIFMHFSREWDFLLPEYMVHKGYQASFSNPETPPSRGRNAPFYTADMTDADVEDQQGRSATDKTVRIPEVRKQGYIISWIFLLRNQLKTLSQHKNVIFQKL